MTKLSRWLVATLLAAPSLTSCTNASRLPAASTPVPVAPPATSPTPSPAADPVPAVDPTEAINATGFDLYRRLATERGNLALSPASIEVALAMTYAGARGETARQMAAALHLPPDTPGLHAGFGALVRAWNTPRAGLQLQVTNRLFGEATARWEDPFLALTRDRYAAPLEPVSFIGAPEPARQRINAWVAEQTRQRVRDLLPQGSIDPDTRLVLTNTVYFKGTWRARFDAAATRPEAFHAPGGDVTTPMMHQSGTFRTGVAPGARLLELPYVGDAWAMVVVLPDAPDGLGAVEQQVNPAWLTRAAATLHPTEDLAVALPRFKVDPPAATALGPVLRDLGMSLPFARAADFSGMSTTIRPLFIDEVFHKAFVEVNEEGTEAAAATAVVMATEGAAMPPRPFVADRPFLFLIRDTRTGAVLFLGRVVRPQT